MAFAHTHAPEPWLSILIPVYNVSAYIGPCLDSVLAQSADDPGIELILLDDASRDDSWAQVEAYAARHPGKLRLLRHPDNRGLSAARNTLLTHATGRYVWFLDSDDMLLAGAVAGLRDIVHRHQPDLILCDYRLLDDTQPSQSRRKSRMQRTHTGPSRRCMDDPVTLLSGLLTCRQPHAWSKIAKRPLWAAAPFPEGRYFEDIAVLPSLLAVTRTWWHTATPWVAYRRHGSSILATLNEKKFHDLVLASELLQQGLSALPVAAHPKVAHALEYFQLRTFCNLAVQVKTLGPEFDRICRQSLQRIFPHGTRHAIAYCRRRGWWLRAWRAQRKLAQAGWLT
ncbi:glycosyltransferase family 2 protein [Thermomonas hydrothermalis]|uniref:Glycosyltransferase involved in cell wall bisynthesis n=1 Tax=Thermomonas hydrothermalis TaxID=213588 RepID=A0A1M4ZDI1_9GAMM|nr:glycosyltransferase family 2 protein [Thermomonas hydrothermalis]SHF15842.1 Glycosyltransferase involved in cell wall bisynthesis [Thermomonas hydrothermalis]